MIVFNLGNRRSVQLYPDSSELPGKGILRERWLTVLSRFSHSSANNVFSDGLPVHAERVPSLFFENVLN